MTPGRDEAMGLFPDWQEAMHGVPWEGEWVFNVPATIDGAGIRCFIWCSSRRMELGMDRHA